MYFANLTSSTHAVDDLVFWLHALLDQSWTSPSMHVPIQFVVFQGTMMVAPRRIL